MPRKQTVGRFSSKFQVSETQFWDGVPCWEWVAAKNSDGYGNFWYQGSVRSAHRAAYELFVGPIPEGLESDHRCRNRACVNPAHLELVTHQENMHRGDTLAAKCLAKTHCPAGHPYDGTNTYRGWKNRRRCRACDRERSMLRRRGSVTSTTLPS